MRDTLPKLPASERGRHVAINSSDLFALGVDDTSSLLESLQKTSEGFHWRVAEVLSEAPLGSYWGLAGVSLGSRWELAGGSLGARWTFKATGEGSRVEAAKSCVLTTSLQR